jgi:hypothetical protein
MMGRRIRIPLLAAGSALVLAAGALAIEEPAPTTIVDLASSAEGGQVEVTGVAEFGGEPPQLVGEDPEGDNVGGPATGAVGLDIVGMSIFQPDAQEDALVFRLHLAGLAGGGIPEGIQYNWDVEVDGGAAFGGSNWSLKTMRSRASATGDLEPYAGVFECTPSDTGFSCGEVDRVTATYDADAAHIDMHVPMALIGAAPGSTIDAWPRATNPVWIGPSASGALTLTNLFDTAWHNRYTVPRPEVRVWLGDPDDPMEPLAGPVSATVGSSGAFSATLDEPAGEWVAVAEACFGDNCDVAVEGAPTIQED